MPEQEFLSQNVCETRDEGWRERTPCAGVRIAREHEDGIMASGIAAETLPKDLRIQCVVSAAWLVRLSTEERRCVCARILQMSPAA